MFSRPKADKQPLYPPEPRTWAPDERERVVAWRTKQLYLGGFPHEYASRLAKDREIDYHEALELLEKSGDLELTLSILL